MATHNMAAVNRAPNKVVVLVARKVLIEVKSLSMEVVTDFISL